MDGWMERKHSGGRILRTQAMKPKLRAHDSDCFTVLGQAATGVLMGSDSTACPPAVPRRTAIEHRTPPDGGQ